MDKVMIALVSDQRMQNVIPILQNGATYSELVLVLSKERSTGKPLQRYVAAAMDLKATLSSSLKVNTSDNYVDPYNIDAVAATVRSLVDEYVNKYGGKNKVVVNVSGGTKPMSIGALRAAQQAGVDCLYTNTEDGEILRLSPDGSIRAEPIVVQGLDVPHYILAYGEKVKSSKKVAELDQKQRVWAQIIGDQHAVIYEKVIVPIASVIKDTQRKRLSFPIVCKVTPTRRQQDVFNFIKQLADKGLWEWDQETKQIKITSDANAAFLNGAWVEIYVAMQMENSKAFDDVRLNIILEGVEGEIDVAAVSNGRLVLVECKSNVQQSLQLSKLDSFRRRLGGPYAQAYYARASEAYARRIRAQCQKFQLDGVFFGQELCEIGNKIASNLKPKH